MITVVKDAILEAIRENPQFKGFQVEEYPDDFKSYQFTSAQGCVLVRDDGSNFAPPETIEKIVNGETIRVSTIVGLRYLPTKAEQYSFIRGLIGELRGLKILEKRLYPVNRKYLGKIDSDHWHGIQFEIKVSSQYSNHNEIPVFEAG